MKTSLVVLLIGAIVAVSYTLPDDDDDDKLAKMAIFRISSPVRAIICATDLLTNSQKQKVAMQENDDGDDNQVTTEEDDDDDDGNDKAKTQFYIHLHFNK